MNRVLSLLLSLALTFTALATKQPDVSWTVFPVFAAPPQKVIDTGKMVYYISGGSLFSFDKERNESFSHTTGNGLNGTGISNIFYDPVGRQLLIAYSSGNIDIIDREEAVANLSDIAESSVAPPLTINSAAFSGDHIYLATAFGLVEFSSSRHEVVQSGIYNRPVTAVAVIDGNIVIACDGKLMTTPIGNRIHSLASFRELGEAADVNGLYPAGKTSVIATAFDGTATSISLLEFNFDQNNISGSRQISTRPGNFYLTEYQQGDFLYLAGATLHRISTKSFTDKEIAILPDEFIGSVIGTATGTDEIWSLTNAGIACHSVTGGKLTVLTARHRPEPFSVREVCYLMPTPSGTALLTMNNGSTAYRFDRPGSAGFSKALTLSLVSLTDDESTDLTPYPIEAYLPLARQRQETAGKYVLGPTSVAIDPDNRSNLYISTSTDGVYILSADDGTLIGRYNELNSPLKRIDERNIAYHTSFDRGGNLWMSTTSEGDDSGAVFILPANKKASGPNEVASSDWLPVMTDDKRFPGTHDVQMLNCIHSPIIFRIDAYDHFMAYNTHGTFNDLTDDDYRIHRRPLDQDGQLFAPERYSAICEDRNGAVWIGTDLGIIEIARPAEAMTDGLTVRRLKIPRNDGSGMADYLLGNELVYDITVDGANRKWIATEKSGLYLVSTDGSEIIAHFTTANSPLPSNTVYSVFADPSGEKIYVGTPDGLFACTSGVTSPRPDYSEIKVYPNPVRPDYTGPINIEGLMEGSVVKITNSSGSVIHQGRAEGGKFIWDGYMHGGSRPPSGIYYILVSSSQTGHNKAATAKFMIIN